MRRDPSVAERDRRRRLTDAVNKLDMAMQTGECHPTRDELRALARLCFEQGLIEELIRVRRWALNV